VSAVLRWPVLAAVTILDALAAAVRAIDDAIAELPDTEGTPTW